MSTKQLIIGASGIYFAYLTSSVIYQKLYSQDYESISRPGQTHKFKHPGLCVWIGALLCALFGFIRGIVLKQKPNPISKKEQIILGSLYTANILATNFALVYVTFLTQAIGRNCRYLLVVIVGAFFSRVKKGASLKLNPKKVYVAIVITVGVMMFSIMKDSDKEKNSSFDPALEWKGYILLLISVIADAFFSDSQAYSKINFKPTANHLFTSANFITFILVIIFGILQNTLIEQISFCIDHPRVIIDIISAGSLQVLGQVSIYYVIANFKQHIFPLISTTRKVLTVLISILIYQHSINGWQWFSILLVFGGLAYEVSEEIASKKQKEEEKKQKNQ